MRQDARDGVGCLEHVRVAQRQHRRGARDVTQGDGCLRDRRERAFAADEELREVRLVLRQQVLQRVGRRLAAEATELRADDGQVLRGQLAQARNGVEALAGCELSTHAVDDVHLHRDVDGAAVGDGVRTARVVADHSRDRRAALRRRVRSEPQAVRAAGLLQLAHEDARFDPRGLRGRIDLQHPVEVAGEVDDEAGADRVARLRGTAAARGDRHLVAAGHVEEGHDVLGRLGEGNDLRDDAVVRGVHRVFGPAAVGCVDGAFDAASEVCDEAAHDGVTCP